ncbi:MAG TPA: hypothetical protein VGT24_01565 [Candidatus Acidoferrales bacterium]|nr:hypothetical protein [Candidatus Acidoferrales bacterium]
MAKKSRKDTSGGEPREVELKSTAYVPRPKGDPGPDNSYNDVYRNYPTDPLGLLPGARGKKR